MKKRLGWWLLLFIAHLSASFVAWSLADRAPGVLAVYRLLSLPLLATIRIDVGDRVEVWLLWNSLVASGIIVAAATLVLSRRHSLRQ